MARETPAPSKIQTLIGCLAFALLLLASSVRAQTNVLVYDNHFTETVAGRKVKVSGFTVTDTTYQRSIQILFYGDAFTVRTNANLFKQISGDAGKQTLYLVKAFSPRAGWAGTFSARGTISPLQIGDSTDSVVKVFSWEGTDIGNNTIEQWVGTAKLDVSETSHFNQNPYTVDSAATEIYNQFAEAFPQLWDNALPGY